MGKENPRAEALRFFGQRMIPSWSKRGFTFCAPVAPGEIFLATAVRGVDELFRCSATVSMC